MSEVSLKDQFLAVREQAIWLSTVRRMAEDLFDRDADEIKTLRQSIGWFLTDLNRILIEYWIIIACRLTDPAKAGSYANATILALDDALTKHDLMTGEIESLSAALHCYREKIARARSKRVAHLDFDVIHSTDTSVDAGATSRQDFDEFFENLQRYTDAVGWVVGEGPLDYRSGLAGPGDAADMINFVLKHRSLDND